MLPLSRSGRVRAPWPPSSCARLLYPLSRPVAGVTSDQLGSASLSTVCTASRLVAFTLQDPSIDRDPRHSFRSLMADVARPRPRDGRNPSSSRRKRTPWPPPTSTRLLLCGIRTIARPTFRLSPDDLPRGDSRFPSSDFLPHGSQGHVGHVTIQGIATRHVY